MRSSRPLIAATLVVTVALCAGGVTGTATAAQPAPASADSTLAEGEWLWPVDGERRVVRAFLAPEHDYGPGHRGVDLVAASGAAVRAPADGVVAFVGVVVDRPLITIDHGDGLVTTVEPVSSHLSPGTVVAVGDGIGSVATGGHAATGTLHLGLRLDGVYIDPMALFGSVQRAVLLPCCAPL